MNLFPHLSCNSCRSFTLYSSHSFFFILSEQVLWILSFFFSVARLAAVLLRALKHVVRCLCVDILHLLTVLVYVPSTSRAWNLFRISTLNLVLKLGVKTLVSPFSCLGWLWTFIFSFIMTKQWSLAAPAPRYTLVSSTDLLHFRRFIMWSIW